MPPKPFIAVPAYPVRPGRIEGWIDAGVAVPEPYLAALKRAGAQEAVLMPEVIAATAAHDLLDHFDGLLLLGGGDLDPATYGAKPDRHLYGINDVRDAFELALCRAAIDRGMPTLAICRGAQTLNIVLGGSLDQHITGRTGLLDHGTPGIEGGATLHDLEIDAGSRLGQAMGTTDAECSSHHHQAMDRLGTGLRVTARAPDGIVEGIELDGDAWIVGAQWHPEDTAGRDPVQQSLFDTFVREDRGRVTPPTLETERLRMQAWRDEDLDAYAALCADPEVMRWHGAHGETKTRDESAEQLAGFRRHWDEHGYGLWCTTLADDDTCIGFIGLATPTFLPEVMPSVEIGWRLNRASWGHGYATEGARAAMAYAFGTVGLDRLVSVTRPENRNSWNVMQKLGMTLERTTTHPEYKFDVVVYEIDAP